MVTTTCFPPSAGRRYPSLRTPYLLASYVERKAVELPHHRDPSSGSMMGDREGGGGDDTSSQRKRIAVACGRCRKRKIRCSGDAGNGQPCTNCRNAGFEPCQFLRVSSQEVSQVKGNAFSYNIDVSRLVQARASSVASPLCVPVGAYHDALGLADGQPLPGRGAPPAPAPAYAGKPYFAPAAGWSAAYAEDAGVDYTACAPPLAAVPEPPYVTPPPFRLPPAAKPGSLLCIDAEAYGYAGVRQSPTAEAGCLPYPGVAPGLPARSVSGGGAERLPAAAAAAGRTLPGSGGPPAPPAPPQQQQQPPYRTDGDYRKNSQHSAGGSSASSPVVDVPPSSYHHHGYDAYGSQAMAAQLGRAGDVFAAPASGPEAGYRFSDPAFNHAQGSGSQAYLFPQRQHEPYAVSGDVDAGAEDRKPPVKMRV